MTKSLASLCANKNWEEAEQLLAKLAPTKIASALETTHGTSKWTPLHYAALTKPTPSLLQTLISHGASPSAQGSAGCTPLHLAAWNDTDAVEPLIEAGADPEARTVSGRTALHFAASRGNIKVVQLLMKAGGKDCGDGDGVSACEFARAGGWSEIIGVLDEYTKSVDDGMIVRGVLRDSDESSGGVVRRTGLASLINGKDVKKEPDRLLSSIRGDVVMAGAVGFVLGVLAPKNGR